jgi:hypothetical protein
MTPPRKGRRGLIIGIVVGALLLVIGVPVGILAWRASSGATESAEGDDRTRTIEPGQPVTDKTLSEVDPLSFYESVIKRQMTAPIGRLKSASYLDRQRFADGNGMITDAAIDHATDEFYLFKSLVRGPEDDDPFNTACVDGKAYSWSTYSESWRESTSSDECTKKPRDGGGDSVVSSGLTVKQANKVLEILRSYKGHVNAAQPTLLKAGKKSYVRQVVDLKPIILADDSYWGSAIPMWAFRDAGLDPVTWPWTNHFALAAGIHIVYYLDTETLLPAVAYQEAIDVPDNPNGEPGSKQEGITVINYSFPESLPKTPVLDDKPNTLTIDLPEGWKVR